MMGTVLEGRVKAGGVDHYGSSSKPQRGSEYKRAFSTFVHALWRLSRKSRNVSRCHITSTIQSYSVDVLHHCLQSLV